MSGVNATQLNAFRNLQKWQTDYSTLACIAGFGMKMRSGVPLSPRPSLPPPKNPLFPTNGGKVGQVGKFRWGWGDPVNQ